MIAKPLFRMGRPVATPGALAALEQSSERPTDFLARHTSGDWGEVCAEDRRLNDESGLVQKDGNQGNSRARGRKETDRERPR